MHEKFIDHILPHCVKTRVLWEIFFTLFGVSWMLPSSVRAMLLGWNSSFVGKKHKKVWRAGLLYILQTVWNARNRIVFKGNVLSIQKLKGSFICFFWSETKMFVKDGPSPLISFIDWLSSCWGWGCFCTSFLATSFLFELCGDGCFYLVYFESLF